MKTLTLAIWITLSALAGCGVTEPDEASEQAAATTEAEQPPEAAPGDGTSLQQLLPPSTPAFACQASNAACLTTRECHQQEGTNIGIAGCPSGTTCCVF
jgi:hypothetical protein